MFYETDMDGREVYVDIPEDLDQKKAMKVLLHNTGWEDKGLKDPPEETDESEHTSYPYAELLHPNLFIHQEGEEYYSGDTRIVVEDGVQPDMDYFTMIDRDFFEKMIYHWSKVDDYDMQDLLDVIDENKDYIVDSAFVIDILE